MGQVGPLVGNAFDIGPVKPHFRG